MKDDLHPLGHLGFRSKAKGLRVELGTWTLRVAGAIYI